jgi:hypothetical protein
MAPMAKRAFVCYARKDEQFVLRLAASLQKRGCALWVDKWDIPPGADWDRTVDEALRSCWQFLFILSPNAVNSPEVRGELRTALDLHKYIVPVLYQVCDIPRQLLTTQYADFSHGNPNHEASLQQLVQTLKHWDSALLGRPSLPDSAPQRPHSRPKVDTQAPAHQQSPRSRALQLELWHYVVLLAGAGLLLAILLFFVYFNSRAKSGVPFFGSHPPSQMALRFLPVPSTAPTSSATHTTSSPQRQAAPAAPGATAKGPHPSQTPSAHLLQKARQSPAPAVGGGIAEVAVDYRREAPSGTGPFRRLQGPRVGSIQPAATLIKHFFANSIAHRRLNLFYLNMGGRG